MVEITAKPRPGESLDAYQRRRLEEILGHWPEYQVAFGELTLQQMEELLIREYRGQLN